MRLQAENLLEFVLANISLNKNQIIEKAGYIDDNGSLQYSHFYDEFIKNSLCFSDDRHDVWRSVSDFLHEKGGGCSPMLNGPMIIGCFGIRISSVASMHDWDEVDFGDVHQDEHEAHLDGPYEAYTSTPGKEWCSVTSDLESAYSLFAASGGKSTDLFRPCYNSLGDDGIGDGMLIENYLDKCEEHPVYYVRLSVRLGLPSCKDSKLVHNLVGTQEMLIGSQESYLNGVPLYEISQEVSLLLDHVIDANLSHIDPEGPYKVYADRDSPYPDRFYLDSVKGSNERSLHALIHYIMEKEGIYNKFLGIDRKGIYLESIYNKWHLDNSVDSFFDALFPLDKSIGIQGEVKSFLRGLYSRCISHVAQRLRHAGLNIEVFSDYLRVE